MKLSSISLNHLKQIRFLFYRVAYGSKENFEKARAEWLENARKKLPHLNKLLAKSEYVTGKLSYVDVVVYDFSLVLSVFAPELLQENPNITRHFKTVNSLPQILTYRNGKGKGGLISSSLISYLVYFNNPIVTIHLKLLKSNDLP